MSPLPGERPLRVLVLCTANQCRSPLAQALLQDRLRSHGVPATVTSAGLRSGGRPADPHAVRTAADRDLDLSEHVSRTVDQGALAGADLVLTMERQHVRQAVLLEPRCWPVAFSVADLLERGREAGPRGRRQTTEQWLAGLHADRRLTDAVGGPASGDVPDPVGRSLRTFRATADRLDTDLDELAGLLAGNAPVAGTPRPRRGWRGQAIPLLGWQIPG